MLALTFYLIIQSLSLTVALYYKPVVWHGYDPNKLNITKENCSSFHDVTRPLTSDEIYDWKLWPGLMNPFDVEHGETIYGMREALKAIFEHQFPKNCSNVKFLVSDGFASGFGSRLHVEGLGLALALQLGRVYISRNDSHSFLWETNVNHCKQQGKFNMYCFYEEWTNCSLEDALQGIPLNKLNKINNYVDTPMDLFQNKQTAQNYANQLSTQKAIILELDWRVQGYPMIYQTFPLLFEKLLDCSPVMEKHKYYWWRSISAAFLTRPNEATLHALSRYRSVPLSDRDYWVSVYIRHGDKWKEMKLVSTSTYLDNVERLLLEGYIPGFIDLFTFLFLNRNITIL